MANTTNQKIQRALASAGQNVGYREAAAIAAKTGTSVDRVFNQTARTGQGATAGAAAAAAGYVPGSAAKVHPTMTGGYVQQVASGAQDVYQQQQEGTLSPEFDWEAWNAQMMAQQAAVWESMDAMNSEFLRQQQEWMAQQANQPRRSSILGGGSSNADPAAVRRKKRTKSSSGIKTNTGLSTGSAGGAGGSGLSLGGSGGGNGLAIGKNK